MAEDVTSASIPATAEAAPPPGIVTALRAALEASALPDEASELDPGEWDAAAAFLAETAARRQPGKPNLRLESSREGQGSARHMRLAIVNDDMPFLVDSVAGAIADAGVVVVGVLHPVVSVERDSSGALTAIGSGSTRESMIYLELQRVGAHERRHLVESIERVLADVRAAVTDWTAMQGAMRADIDRLGSGEEAELLRWFLDRNFTQLGHELRSRDGAAGSGLGLCRDGADGEPLLAPATLEAAFAQLEGSGAPLLLVKSNRMATVHRRVLLDVILVPVREGGRVAALSIHAGLWTSAALNTAPDKVPVLRRRLTDMATKFGFDPAGHAGKALAHVLTRLPHDLMVASDDAQVEALALAAMSIDDRPRPKVAFIASPLERHLFAFVWLPRDELSTARRQQIAELLAQEAGGKLLSWTISMEESGVALIRYTYDLRGGGRAPDVERLNAALEQLVRGWEPGIEAELARFDDSGRASVLAHRFAGVFPQTYRISHAPEDAAADVMRLREMGPARGIDVRLLGTGETTRLKVYHQGGALSLSRLVPTLENFGYTVDTELPTALTDDAKSYIHDLTVSGGRTVEGDRVGVVEAALADVLLDRAENDAFNQLIVAAGLDPVSVVWLRAWFRYLRQGGLPYSLPTVVQALRNAPEVTRGLVALFRALHDPAALSDDAATAARATIADGLAKVAAIDEDRILRQMSALIEATLRTNAFVPAGAEALAFKIDSAKVPGLPRPLPWREIWVYSPRVEGIHLRAGPVARGGLRWSDRRDDFRTEILGLMKAQRVKNAVIVPTGAKGGFHPKRLPDPAADRDAWLAEGTECYRVFIRALLSITDNRVDGAVVPPQGVVRRDSDDPYFVVAADKGTASFSDVANAIALERDFWLGDAFASGGSNGYDHKAMGITAKGAWISVQRHFREMGIDVQTEAVRVAGVGDMSGDVFGNGMLLSQAIELVAAFDHRHIFLDPTPDAAKGWAERKRLFELPRSSWADYDPALISAGGGVFPRSQKSIPLTPEVRAMLDLDVEEIDPTSLISAILKARVDLLWFGGIGTYVKAAAENNAAVGDPANDRHRVDAEELRAKVVGEGANLGVTQAARIAFASGGGRINTDFIDNSAGVDCSDNEVNIKIALNAEMRAGRLALDDRNRLLESMTDEVAELVLADNRAQALALSIAEGEGAAAAPAVVRLIGRFEEEGRLDRNVEGLARDDEYLRRAQDGRGLTRPELAVVMATAKLALQESAEQGRLGDDALMDDELLAAFPREMQACERDAILAHQLRREIVATKVANRLVNRLGFVHPFELAEEEGVSPGEVAEAFVVAERLLDLPALWRDIDAAPLPEPVRLGLYRDVAVEVRAHMADLLRHADPDRSLADCVAQLQAGVDALEMASDQLLERHGREAAASFRGRLATAGVDTDLANRVVRLAEIDGAMGLVALSRENGADVKALTQAFGLLGQATGLDWAQGAAMAASPSDPWERLLVAGLSRDFAEIRLDLLQRLGGEPMAAAQGWLQRNAARVERLKAFVTRAQTQPHPSAAMLAQLGGQAKGLMDCR